MYGTGIDHVRRRQTRKTNKLQIYLKHELALLFIVLICFDLNSIRSSFTNHFHFSLFAHTSVSSLTT